MPTSKRSNAQKKRAAENTADRLRASILRGEYPAGRDLPGERELSQSLGVSRLTLRAALTRLEAEGLVKPMHGSGNRVLDFRETGGLELLGHVLAHSARGVPLSLLANLLELRRALVIEAIGLAAQRATPAEIEQLKQQIEIQASLIAEPQAYVQADLHFAKLLARSAHNVALTFLANSIIRMLEKHEGIHFAFFVDPQSSLNVYRKFVQVIESRDPHIARTFAKRFITRYDRKVLETIGAFAETLASN